MYYDALFIIDCTDFKVMFNKPFKSLNSYVGVCIIPHQYGHDVDILKKIYCETLDEMEELHEFYCTMMT